jgi:hypothetical protein
VAAFTKQTGLDARKDMKLGDFSDPAFRKWIDFRIQTMTDFMVEIDQSAKSVNPDIKTIPEIYPGIEEEAVRVGADVYSLYPVVDAIARTSSARATTWRRHERRWTGSAIRWGCIPSALLPKERRPGYSTTHGMAIRKWTRARP